VLCCPASSDYVVSRGAYGVYFHYKGVLEVGTDVWIHTFDIALPVVKSLPPYQNKTALNCQFRNTPLNGNCSDYLNTFSDIHQLHQRAEVQINTLVKRIRNVLRRDRFGRKKPRVSRRGFVDFIVDVHIPYLELHVILIFELSRSVLKLFWRVISVFWVSSKPTFPTWLAPLV